MVVFEYPDASSFYDLGNRALYPDTPDIPFVWHTSHNNGWRDVFYCNNQECEAAFNDYILEHGAKLGHVGKIVSGFRGVIYNCYADMISEVEIITGVEVHTSQIIASTPMDVIVKVDLPEQWFLLQCRFPHIFQVY
jgi:hypothetical protein